MSVSGGGVIDSATGVFTAQTLGSGFTVTAVDGSISGIAGLEVVPAKPLLNISSQGIGYATTTYEFMADASDPDGTISQVEFY